MFLGVMIGRQNEESDRMVRSKMIKYETTWHCSDCPFVGEGKTKSDAIDNLYKHVENTHVDVSFNCLICFKTCKTRRSLLVHRSRNHKHDGSRTFSF